MKARRGRLVALVGAGLWLSGCGQQASEEVEESAAPGISDETLMAIEGDNPEGEELVSFAVPTGELITGEGVGEARIGDTLGALQAVIGDRPIRFEQRFAPGLSAVCVEDESGAELYCAAFGETSQPGESTVVTMVATRHPQYRTQAGVGPGIAVADAAEVYGDAFLVLIDDGEEREYVEFEFGPPDTISFRPLVPSRPGALAGEYDDDEEAEDAGFRETDVYRDDTIIGVVEVIAP